MKNCREEWYDKDKKVAVTIVDVTEAAQALARGHLCGPTSAYYLTKALAAVSLLGAETSEKDETVILQMKCSGPLGGFNVECTSEGTLRGYTEKKILDAFDGLGTPKDKMVLGDKQIQITRSVPGRILSQGIAATLDGYLVGSLQRKACIYLEAAVNDEVEILEARGVLVDAPHAQTIAKSEGDGERIHSREDVRRQPQHPDADGSAACGAPQDDAAHVRLPLFAGPSDRDARGLERRGEEGASADLGHHLSHVRQDLHGQDEVRS